MPPPPGLDPSCLNLNLPVALTGVIKCSQVSLQGLEKISQSVTDNVESWKHNVEALKQRGGGLLSSGLAGERWNTSASSAPKVEASAAASAADTVSSKWGTEAAAGSSLSKALAESDVDAKLKGSEAGGSSPSSGPGDAADVGSTFAALYGRPGSVFPPPVPPPRSNIATEPARWPGLTGGGDIAAGGPMEANKPQQSAVATPPTSQKGSSPRSGKQLEGALQMFQAEVSSEKGSEPERTPNTKSPMDLDENVEKVSELGRHAEFVPPKNLEKAAKVSAGNGSASSSGASPSPSEPTKQDRDVDMSSPQAVRQNSELSSISSSRHQVLEDRTCCRPGFPRCCKGVSCQGFPCCSMNCPILFAAVLLLLVVLFCAVLWPGVEVDTDLSGFLQADGEANDVRLAFLAAFPYRGLDAAGTAPRRLATLRKDFQFMLMYRSSSPGGMLGERELRFVKEIELKLRDLPGWKKLCERGGEMKSGCEPGMSLINYVWPEQEVVSIDQLANVNSDSPTSGLRYKLTGRGRAVASFDAAISLVSRQHLEPVIFPKDVSPGQKTQLLRSFFEFLPVVFMQSDPLNVQKEQIQLVKQMWADLIAEEIVPTLQDIVENQIPELDLGLELFWMGSGIQAQEVFDALKSDSLKAIGSGTFIVLYLTLHTRSPLLSTGALLLCILSIPMAFVMTGVLSGTNRVTGAHFLSLFFIAGFGADVVIVFITFWEAVKEWKDQKERIRYMYKKAGVACLATSLTTAASFFANLASVLKPLREFGFFMGLCIMGAYSLLFFCFPAVLVLNDRLSFYSRGMKLDSRVSRSIAQRISEMSDAPIALKTILPNGEEEGPVWRMPKFEDLLTKYIEKFLFPFKRSCCVICLLLPIILAMWAAGSVQVAGDMPQMFPEGHNGREANIISSEFVTPANTHPAESVVLCQIEKESLDGSKQHVCDLFSCSMGLAPGQLPAVYGKVVAGGNTDCKCLPTIEPGQNCRASSALQTDIRFVGVEEIDSQFWQSPAWEQHVRQLVSWANRGKSTTDFSVYGGSTSLNSLVQEHWESGEVGVAPFLRAPNVQVGLDGGSACEVAEICYCGAPACRLHGEGTDRWSSLSVPTPSGRRLSSVNSSAAPLLVDHDGSAIASGRTDGGGQVALRRTASPGIVEGGLEQGHFAGRQLRTTASSATSVVSLIFGLEVLERTPLLGEHSGRIWDFSSSFYPEDPRVQRHMLKACTEVQDMEGMRIGISTCWIEEFRNWLLHKGEIFPVRSMHFKDMLKDFSANSVLPTKEILANRQMFFDASLNLRASVFQFDVLMSSVTTRSSTILEYMKKWDAYVLDLNHQGPIDAGEIWHTSALWIRAEAETAIIESTVQTMIVSLAFGLVGALFSTHFDIALSLLVCWSVGGVIITLLWFMVVVMGWAMGPIEVLGLIVFVGYSITYSLHVAHKYRHHVISSTGEPAKRREEAVEYSLTIMTTAVIGSAVTTLGASFFLFFCVMSIFVKLATVLFAVTFFAAAFAVVVLPTALANVGPLGFWSWCNDISSLLSGESLAATSERLAATSSNLRGSLGGLGRRSSGGDEESPAPGPSSKKRSSTVSQGGGQKSNTSRITQKRQQRSSTASEAAPSAAAAAPASGASPLPRGRFSGKATTPPMQPPQLSTGAPSDRPANGVQSGSVSSTRRSADTTESGFGSRGSIGQSGPSAGEVTFDRSSASRAEATSARASMGHRDSLATLDLFSFQPGM